MSKSENQSTIGFKKYFSVISNFKGNLSFGIFNPIDSVLPITVLSERLTRGGHSKQFWHLV